MTDDQFTQLRDQLAGVEDKLTNQMTGLDSKLTNQMSGMQTQINNLDKGLLNMFKYMTKRFDVIENKLDGKAGKAKINTIYNQLDSFLKRTDTDETERAALATQVKRHEGWIHQIAKSTGDKLTY